MLIRFKYFVNYYTYKCFGSLIALANLRVKIILFIYSLKYFRYITSATSLRELPPDIFRDLSKSFLVL